MMKKLDFSNLTNNNKLLQIVNKKELSFTVKFLNIN